MLWRDSKIYIKGRINLRSDATELNLTELNWNGLVFDELTNGQAVMHYTLGTV